MAKLPKKLEQKLEKRRLEDALRILPEQQSLIDFSSNDYLGLAGTFELSKLTDELLDLSQLYKNGSTGSRLLSGNHTLYGDLEEFLAHYHDSESALIFNSGYDANIGFFSSVPQRGDIIFYDELIHASIRDGIKMGNAKSYRFAHNDLNDLRQKVEMSLRVQSRSMETEIYIITESVFSMDGDSPDLEALVKFCSENDYNLIVDEAHAVGIFGEGKGLICQLGLEKEVFARVVTFGKALGSHGAVILCNSELKAYLVNFARSLIYTTALSPHSIASVLIAYSFMMKEGEVQRKKLYSNIHCFKKQISLLKYGSMFVKSDSAICCLIVPGNQKVKQLSKRLREEGFDVKPILSPTVKAGEERLRFCLHSYNTKEEIESLFQIIRAQI
ncbi:aminotransferase class I/II-fold pyridoxal phosphate-dependent enzyme [Flagellimonas pacifica]|uniref:8-amino-7-oxononanoate synthase n=1 Tax=Flagellimonas pacifica TaxID=1247520 RepID=A0A285MC19_9FLAO|nr:8-amino-7-oxononanoate synthase [Allomuricauda parva]SNY94700.1 8-amino-7-oxononanoate synthase [Allomuricauda parva]